MKRRSFVSRLVPLAAGMFGTAADLSWSAPSAINASIRLQGGSRPVNRLVLGVGLMYPPFDTLADALGSFSESSVRVWSHIDAQWWKQFETALVQLKPSKVLAFNNELSRHADKVFYRSAADNNLSAAQQVEQMLLQIQYAIDRLVSINTMPAGGFYWEVWNEPELKKNGSWPAPDMARYANEIASAVRQKKIPVKILVPLSMYDPVWSEQLCAKLDPNLVDGLVNHYYYYQWNTVKLPEDEFLARASGGPILSKLIGQDKMLIDKYGKGRWALHCSEWNLEPPDFSSPPFNITRDMAAALYALDSLKIYLANDLATAQFFLFANRDQHFAAITTKKDGPPIVRPAGALFGLLHKHLNGQLLELAVDSEGYERRAKNETSSTKIAYINAMAARKADGYGALFVSNKHPSLGAEVDVSGFGLPPTVDADLLIGTGDKRDIAGVSRIKLPVAGGKVRLPAASISVIYI
jgi:hypothetical protein